MAFRRPDGKLVLVAANMRVYGAQMSVRIGRDFLEALLPPRSFNTFILDNPQDKSVSTR
jgi:O-glycosyl hydrolase